MFSESFYKWYDATVLSKGGLSETGHRYLVLLIILASIHNEFFFCTIEEDRRYYYGFYILRRLLRKSCAIKLVRAALRVLIGNTLLQYVIV